MSAGVSRFARVLRLAQNGDLLAIRDLYESYAPAVHGYLRGHGATDPDDVTSEVFVGMLRNLDSFAGPEEAFRAWLFVITHRRLLDERRRLGRNRTVSVDPETIRELAHLRDRDAGDLAVDEIQNGRVLQLLDSLTETQRSVVLLHTIGGLPLKRVAEILGKELGAVKSLHRRALAAVARSSELQEFERTDDR